MRRKHNKQEDCTSGYKALQKSPFITQRDNFYIDKMACFQKDLLSVASFFDMYFYFKLIKNTPTNQKICRGGFVRNQFPLSKVIPSNMPFLSNSKATK